RGGACLPFLILYFCLRRSPPSILFPYTTLFRSLIAALCQISRKTPTFAVGSNGSGADLGVGERIPNLDTADLFGSHSGERHVAVIRGALGWTTASDHHRRLGDAGS